METAFRGNAKRKHLSVHDCAALSCTSEGTSSLTQPFTSRRSSSDLNRGLYPRTTRKRVKPGANDNYKQSGITDYFPVTGHCTISPHKMAEGMMEEDSLNGDMLADEEALQSSVPEDFFLEDFAEETAFKEAVLTASRKRSFDSKGADTPYSQSAEFSGWIKKPWSDSRAHGLLQSKEEEEEIPVDPLPDVHFGLLGTSQCQQDPQGHISHLPEELLMSIFSHLPAQDLYQHISVVCQRWRAIVNDPLFVPWKKLYFQYRKGKSEAVKEIEQILSDNHITEKEQLCVMNLVKYMSQFKHSRSTQPEAVLKCLKDHYLYPQAEACISNRMPEEKIDGAVNVWAAFALIVLLSDGMRDVHSLVTSLRRPSSTLSLSQISEMLHCMAALLFAMRENGINISSRFHYNLFYALHLMENCTPFSRTQESGKAASGVAEINLTHEQQQILNHEITKGHVVKIMAFAGTGKTSTLIKYAQQRPHLRFLYAAFNKSVAVQAKRLFPSNVDCKTIHSMAYQQVGYMYKKYKKLNMNSCVKPFSVAWVLPEGRGGFVRAKLVTQTLQTFFASADRTITTDHVPMQCKNTRGEMELVEHTEKLKIADDADGLWEKMKWLKETKESSYHMTHDGNLKLWQLKRPCLNQYDVIFIDEAQDCTPAIMDIILSQSCGKILVGDPHQQIYTFRGAVNALYEVPHTHIYYLTQSFRFGPEIAYVGATLLDVCKKVKKTLVGGNQEGNVRGNKEGKIAILSRSNSTVFDEAVRVTEREKPPKIHIIGGVDSFGLRKILDIWILLQPEEERKRKNLEIVDKFICYFTRKGGYRGLKEYVFKAEDGELEGKISVVEKYTFRIPELVQRIKDCSVIDLTFADIALGTVHKAKGLEFDTVEVTDDFAKVPCARHNLHRLPRFNLGSVPDDEWNLLYVAVTRAKKCLVMTKSIENLLTLAGEYFLRSELTSNLFKEGQLPRCTVRECHNTVREEAVLTMKKMPIKYSDKVDVGGSFCSTCVEQRLGPITYLTGSAELVKSMHYTVEHVDLPANIARLLALI
ncbi:F-box DNA helicase 1 [Polyodon spathula]|uniref:F-box DNA helicase 1 n=1 Tax=Polyodon spathula TaxID=7913 RepID=UPI001B7F73D0|nr:F-box DNA helicase 1 [Polyodon spathula]